MAVAEISVVPLGTGSAGVSGFVAGCLNILSGEKGLRYQLTPMGTILEGDLDTILHAVRKMHDQPFVEGAPRVLTTIRIDDRRDKVLTMEGKVTSVEKKLNNRGK